MRYLFLLFSSALASAFAVPATRDGSLILAKECSTSPTCYAAIDFLYWQGGEDGLEYAFSNSGSEHTSQRGSVKKLDFQWEPAVRLLFGVPFPEWNLDFTYTYYKTMLSKQSHHPIEGLGSGLIPVWTAPYAFHWGAGAVRWADASADWKFRSDFFDLRTRQCYCIGSKLSVEPSFGLFLALLRQSYALVYRNGNTAIDTVDEAEASFLSSQLNMKCHSLNMGPAFGLASRWELGGQTSLFASASTALLGSRFATSRDESDFSRTESHHLVSDFARLRTTHWTFRSQAAFQFGFSWGHCFENPSAPLSCALSVAYEAQYWWKQNAFLRYANGDQSFRFLTVSQFAPTQGDLFFHGLTAEGRLAF